jgi:hypothetical protein
MPKRSLILSLDEFKMKWEGVIKTPNINDFMMLFQMWLEESTKCVCTGG